MEDGRNGVNPDITTINSDAFNQKMLQLENELEVLKSSANDPELVQRIDDIQTKLGGLEHRVQASIDLTDDLVSTSNMLIDSVQNRVDDVMSTVDHVLAHTDTVVDVYLWVLGGIVAAAVLVISWFVAKKTREYKEEAVDQVVSDIVNNGDARNELAVALLRNSAFLDTILPKFEKVIEEAQNNHHQSNETKDKVKAIQENINNES